MTSLAKFSADLRDFSRRGIPMIGQEYARELTRELMNESHRRHSRFPVTGRLWRATRPYVNNPRRGAGFGARMPALVPAAAVDRLNFKDVRRFGIRNAATNPRNGYEYSRQIWAGRGFRGGQMRGSVSLPGGVRDIATGAFNRKRAAWNRAIARVQKSFPRT